MQIPVGLMSPTALRNQRTNGNPDQGYWQGDRFVFPKYKPKPPPSLMSPDLAQAVQTVQDTAQKAQDMAIARATVYGDGPQGEGFGGGRDGSVAPGNSPSFSEAGHVNAPDQNANVAGMMGQPAPTNTAGLPSLPDFKENTTPAAPTTPANQDLAVSEVDPQGPSGAASAGKSKGSADVGPAKSAAGLAARSAMNKGLAEDQEAANIGKATTSFMDAMKGVVDQSRGMVGNLSTSRGMAAAAAAAEKGITSGNNEFGKTPSEQNAAARSSASNTGSGTGSSSGGVGADGIGGPGAGGMGSPGGIGGGGSGAPGGSSDQGPGSWRAGGRTGNDGDKRRLEPRGTAHEDEFYFNPEMTSLMDRRAPGMLDALDRFQKGLMDRPRKQARGLMGR